VARSQGGPPVPGGSDRGEQGFGWIPFAAVNRMDAKSAI